MALVRPVIDITSRAVTKCCGPSRGRASSNTTAARSSGMKTNERDLSVTLPAWSVAFKVSWLGPGSGWYERLEPTVGGDLERAAVELERGIGLALAAHRERALAHDAALGGLADRQIGRRDVAAHMEAPDFAALARQTELVERRDPPVVGADLERRALGSACSASPQRLKVMRRKPGS